MIFSNVLLLSSVLKVNSKRQTITICHIFFVLIFDAIWKVFIDSMTWRLVYILIQCGQSTAFSSFISGAYQIKWAWRSLSSHFRQKPKHTEWRSWIRMKWIAYTCLWVALFFTLFVCFFSDFPKKEIFVCSFFMKLYSSLSCESILLFHLVWILFRLQSTQLNYKARASWPASMNCLQHYTLTLMLMLSVFSSFC